MAKTLAAAHSDDIVRSLTKINATLSPASTSRISSLYVFDAIARAAKSDASKGVDGGSQLLGKMEAAAPGWVDTIIDNGKGGVWSEGRVSSIQLRPHRVVELLVSRTELTIRTRRARLWTSGASRRRSRTRASRTCRARLLGRETTGDQQVRYSFHLPLTLHPRCCSSPRRL